MLTHANRVAVATVCVAVLSACSGGGPSDAQMKEAFLLGLTATTGPGATFESFESHGCKGEDKVYRCKLTGVLAYTFVFGEMKEEKTQPLVGTYAFMQTEQGWRLVR